jgi:hypothetical protein
MFTVAHNYKKPRVAAMKPAVWLIGRSKNLEGNEGNDWHSHGSRAGPAPPGSDRGPTRALLNFAGRRLGSIRVGGRGGSVGVGYGKKPSPLGVRLQRGFGIGYGTAVGKVRTWGFPTLNDDCPSDAADGKHSAGQNGSKNGLPISPGSNRVQRFGLQGSAA